MSGLAIPLGWCQCGCGQRTTVSRQNSARFGWVKGQPKRYLPNHHGRRPGPWFEEDPDSGCWVWLLSRDPAGYGLKREGARVHRAHRWLWEWEHGPVPKGFELDHICRNKSCVNPRHLRVVTRAENSQNLSDYGRGKSRYRGVAWTETGRWTARTRIYGTIHYLGRFDTEEQAASALREFRAKHAPFSPDAMRQAA